VRGVQRRRDSARPDLEHLRDLVLGEIGVVPQEHGQALALRQRSEVGTDRLVRRVGIVVSTPVIAKHRTLTRFL
jgi:hypothetical protein